MYVEMNHTRFRNLQIKASEIFRQPDLGFKITFHLQYIITIIVKLKCI
jgi:hypothetical protein